MWPEEINGTCGGYGANYGTRGGYENNSLRRRRGGMRKMVKHDLQFVSVIIEELSHHCWIGGRLDVAPCRMRRCERPDMQESQRL